MNASYQLLKDDLDGMRRMFTTTSAGATTQQEQSSPHERSRENRHHRVPANSCEVCGSLNAEMFTFKRQTGFIFARNVGTLTARFCKGCATAVGRSYQSRTLATGWWGVISLPSNLFYIIQNAQELARARKLADPVAPAGFRTAPMPGGKPIFYRPISWVGIVILAFFALSAAFSQDSSSSNNYSPTSIEVPSADWRVGNCISGYSTVYPVSCSASHSGSIVAAVGSQYSCPPITDKYVTDKGMIYCIDML